MGRGRAPPRNPWSPWMTSAPPTSRSPTPARNTSRRRRARARARARPAPPRPAPPRFAGPRRRVTAAHAARASIHSEASEARAVQKSASERLSSEQSRGGLVRAAGSEAGLDQADILEDGIPPVPRALAAQRHFDVRPAPPGRPPTHPASEPLLPLPHHRSSSSPFPPLTPQKITFHRTIAGGLYTWEG
jgi:hypothetical protein